MEKFCKDLREHVTEISNYDKKEMIPLTDEENKSDEKQKVCYMWKKEYSTYETDKNKFKIYNKVRHHCYYSVEFSGADYSVWDTKHQKKFQ